MIDIYQGNAAALLDYVDAESVACIVTSPPYATGMAYDGVPDDDGQFEYRLKVNEWAHVFAQALVKGGRLWLNVPPVLPVLEDHDDGTQHRWSPMAVWQQALDQAGLRYRDTIVWHQNVADQATAWGSFMSPNAPNLRGRWEAILTYSRGPWRRWDTPPGEILRADGVTEDEFAHWTRNVWTFPPAPRLGDHPCPFPDELPRRAVLLSTKPDELVVDPFMGSGTAVRVAAQLGRHAVGVDLSRAYIEGFST